jgi:5-methylcytosine-specific restriction enzyme subunit McrC
MMRYAPAHNPRNKRSPEPRPDFVVRRGGGVVAMLDAKYRDLWEHDLPREMLYQLAIYALSREAPGGTASTASSVILYPTLAPGAREARIEIRDPVHGRERATVVLRPVDMNELSRLVVLPPTAASADAQRRFALHLCLGDGSSAHRAGPRASGRASGVGRVAVLGGCAAGRIPRDDAG